MKILFTTALMLAFAQACLGAQSSDSEKTSDTLHGDIWIHFDEKWVHAPKDVGPPGLKDAPATLLKFESDGRFFMLQCWVSTYNGGQYHISVGNPYRVFLGKWVDVNGRRQITYKLKEVEHTQLPNDVGTLFRFESAITIDALKFDSKKYRRSKSTITNFAEFESKYIINSNDNLSGNQ